MASERRVPSTIVEPLKAVARKAGIRRTHFAWLRMQAERELIAATPNRRKSVGGRVLCYHSVGTPEWGVNDVPASLFERQMEWAVAQGYRFVRAESSVLGGTGPNTLAVTFDDGLMSVYENAAPILSRLGIPWTVFVVADWADGNHPRPDLFMGWGEIRALAAEGVTVGSHSVTHPNFANLTETEAGTELADSLDVIRERTGLDVDQFAIPFGQSRNWRPELSDLARSLGYRFIYAQAVATRTAGTLPRTFITHFDDERIFRAALQGAFDRWEESS
jgi:peptidoglycan/xylan/chitin deacetylase (PgdA/CDA1 family)